LTLYLQRLDLIEAQITELDRMIADAMKAHEAAIVRLSELPGSCSPPLPINLEGFARECPLHQEGAGRECSHA
jgi:hypothetical protein